MSTISFLTVNSDLKIEETPYDPTIPTFIPLFGKPREVGFFSISKDSQIHFDNRNLRYLISPIKTKNLNLNLNHNLCKDIHRQYISIDRIYQVLYWLKFNQQGNLRYFDLMTESPAVDFVTVRGALVKIMTSPYGDSRYNKWEICASKFRGVVYFTLIDSDEDLEKKSEFSMQVFQAWGLKFEQYLTSDQMDDQRPDMHNKSHQLEEFDVVLKTVLNKHKLLYKAEVDAVIPHRRLGIEDTSCYTELKTYKEVKREEEQLHFSRNRAVRWWAQSYIAGVPDIICGYRTDGGFVKSIGFLNVCDLPEEALGLWSKDACLNFLDKFLSFLKKTVVEDDIKTVYHFKYDGDGKILCSKLLNPEKRYIVIPDWYVNKQSPTGLIPLKA